MKHTSSYLLVLAGLVSVCVGEAQGQRTLAYPLSGARRVTDICFVGAETGTAVGTYGTILRTTDGGITWRPQSAGGEFFLNAVHFTDANTGTVVGFDNYPSVNQIAATGLSLTAFAFSPMNAQLWAAVGTNQIYTIDISTGNTTLVGNTGLNND